MEKELEASFPYIETPDQLLAIQKVQEDIFDTIHGQSRRM